MSCPLHDREQARLYLATHPWTFRVVKLLGRMGPVVRVPGVATFVSDAAVMREILQRDDDFTKNGPGSMATVITQVMGPTALLNQDGEDHRATRRALTDLFHPSFVETVVGEVCEEPLGRLRARLDAGETVDLVAFMRSLTGRMTCHMMGVVPPAGGEEKAYEEIVRLGERIARVASLNPRPLAPAALAEVKVPFDELTAHAKRSYDSPDVARHSVIRRLHELGLDFEQAKGILGILFVVGTQTTGVALPRIVALLEDSGEVARLRADPSLLPSAIDEALRLIVPTPVNIRIAARDTVVGGHRFRRGTRVLLLTYNAARDARVFPDPLRFDPARTHDPKGRHLWYGAGPHFCLGFNLAQRELREVLETLLRADLEIVGRAPARNVLLPAYERLEVRLRRP